MPNTLDATGLTVATTDEIATAITTALQDPTVYGPSANFASNAPDGQMVGIYSQSSSDVLDLLVDVYNIFDVGSAYGIMLQRLVALNGLTIKGGTFTTTPVTITASKAGALPGLDQVTVAPYQVRDSNNLWTLVSSFNFAAPGAQALVFQCATLGAITPLPGTINGQATPQPFVSAVNNPTTAGTVIGQDEETDDALRARHAQSFYYAATGPADAVEAALLDLPDVTDALVVENRTGGTVNDVPAHSLRCVVIGGTAAEIAGAIYSKCAPGPGLYGAQSYTIVRPNGQGAAIAYDVGAAQRLWAQFGVIPTTPGLTFDKVLMAQELAAALVSPYFKLGRQATIGDLVRALYKIEPRAIPTGAGVSTDGVNYGDTVSPSSVIKFFSIAAGDISIL